MGRKVNILAKGIKTLLKVSLRALLLRGWHSLMLAGAILIGVAIPVDASYLPFNTNVNMNVGIGTSLPKNTLEVAGGNIGIGTAYSLVGINSTNTILTMRTDTSSIYVGWQAGASTTIGGLQNAAVGFDALNSVTVGNQNAAMGVEALYKNTGSNNTAMGFNALAAVSSGSENTAVGNLALTNSTGSNNTAVGFDAGQLTGGGANNSLFLGYGTNPLNNNDTNEVVIGYTVTGNGSNTVTLGNTSIVATVLQGNIGIGTFAPNGKLIITGGNVGIGSLAPGQALDVQGTVRALNFIGNGAGLTGVAGTNYWLLNGGAGNIGINTSYAVGIGTAFVGGTGEAALSVMNGNVGIGTWIPAASLDVETAGNTYFGSNVGIGSSAPGQALDVQGVLRTTNFNLSTNPTSGYVLTTDNFGNGTWQSVATTGGWTVSGNNVYETSSGNVGIGTSTVNQGALVITNGNVGIGTWTPIVPLQVVGVGTQTPYGGGVIINNGNVGIGTTVPGSALYVGSGVITSYNASANSGEGIVTYAGNGKAINMQAGTANANILYDNSGGFSFQSEARSSVLAGLSSSTNITMNIDLNGNVGIGTFAYNTAGLAVMNGNVGVGSLHPGQALDVQGTARALGGIFNGNVGIGTWLPANSLDVVGGNIGIGTAFGITAGGNNVISMRTDTTSIYAGTAAGATAAGANLYNVVMGYQALDSSNISTGNYNIALGYQALYRNTSGTNNIAIGNQASSGSAGISGSYNIALGYESLGNSSGSGGFNISLGGNTLYNNSGGNNTAVGDSALHNNGAGTNNTAIGNSAISGGSGGTFNTAVGNTALANSGGTYTVAVGASAGQYIVGGGSSLNTANYSIFLGANTESGANTDSNEIVIGYGAYGNGNNTVTLGNTGISQTVLQGNVGIGTNASNGKLIVTGGNVGIGSLHPGQLLDVQGTVRSSGLTMSGQTPISGYVLTASDSTGDATWTAAGVSSGWTVSGNNVYETGSGNVGIGTSSVTQGALLVTNGNVGIGTWAPVKPLSVIGDTYLKGNLGIGTTFVGGTGEAALTVLNGNVGIGTWVPSSSLYVLTSAANNQDVLALQSSYTTNEFTGPAISFAENFNGTMSTVARVRGIASVAGANTGALTFEINGAGTGTATTTKMILDNNGNLGVGTVTPGSLLQVNGNAAIGYPSPTAGPSNGLVVNGRVGIGTTFVGGTGEAALSVMNGNVGIGTWLPGAMLDVEDPAGNGAIYASSNADAVFGQNTSYGYGVTGDSYYGVGVAANADGNQAALTASNYSVGPSAVFAIGNVGIGTFTPEGALTVMSGNVGIGTWAPGSLLDVNGNINVYGYGTFAGNSNALAFTNGVKGATAGFVQVNNTTFGLLAANNWDVFIHNTSGNGLVVKNSGSVGIGTTTPQGGLVVMNGNVGIGTVSPLQTLEVNGEIIADVQYNYPENYGPLADTNGSLYVPEELLDGNNSPGVAGTCLTSEGPGGQVKWSSCSGSVGIGTGNPSAPYNSVQFNDAGNFGGTSNFVYNGTNVGIGTSLSKNTLDIAGDVSIGTAYAGHVTAPANGVIVQGNVGIGTWSPVDTLQVGKFISTASGFEVDSNGNVGIGTTLTSSAPLSIMSGNVGIGTWVPGDLLEVAGSVPAGGTGISVENESVTGYTGLNFRNSANGYSGAIGYANSGWAADPYETNSIYLESFGGNLLLEGNNIVLNPEGFGNVGIGTSTPQGAFVVTNGNVGIATWAPVDPFQVNGSSQNFYINPNGNLGIGIAAPVDPFQVNGSSQNLYINTNGNLGIGIAAPTAPLQVGIDGAPDLLLGSGAATNNYMSVSGGRAMFGYNNSAFTNGALALSTGTNRGIEMFVAGNNNSFLSGTLAMAISNTANVGISTINPGQRLDVQGTVRAIGLTMSGQTPVSGYVLTASDSNGDATWTSPGSAGGWTVLGNNVYETSGGNVGIGTSFVNGAGEGALTVMNGNVGIGTWLPASMLQVNGAISAEGGNIKLQGDGNGNTFMYFTPPSIHQSGGLWLTDDTNSWIVATNGSGNNLGAGVFSLIDITSGKAPITVNSSDQILIGGSNASSMAGQMLGGSTNLQVIGNSDFGGNIGIGSVAPGQALDVQGTVRALGVNVNGSVGIGTSLTATSALTVMNGNVGIGTWVPGAIMSIPSLKANSGTRYLCIDTNGNVISSVLACSGT